MSLLILWLRAIWLGWWDRFYERFAGKTVIVTEPMANLTVDDLINKPDLTVDPPILQGPQHGQDPAIPWDDVARDLQAGRVRSYRRDQELRDG